MENRNDRFYVLTEQAVPEVLLKVVEVKRLLMREPKLSVKDAVERCGISRSTFYRYREEISPLHRELKGKTINFTLRLEDRPGTLAQTLKTISEHEGNILTIHQSIPIHGVAQLTISMQILSEQNRVEELFEALEKQEGVSELRLLGES